MSYTEELLKEFENWSTEMTVTSGIISLAFFVLQIVSMWFLFKKAGEPGWKAIIPFYNAYIWCKIVWDKNIFWIMLALAFGSVLLVAFNIDFTAILALGCLIALVVLAIMMQIKTSYAYGRGAGTAVGLIFLDFIFMPILAFGSATYVGPQKK